MPSILGRDFRAIFASRFAGRLTSATFTRETVTGVDPSDTSGPPLITTVEYTCDALALSYKERYVDGQHVKKGDYRVIVLLGTVKQAGTPVDVVPNPGDSISVPPPGASVAKAARVVDVDPVTAAFATCHVVGEGA